jgi:ABC-type Fe3+/spermidine/putrescine transport system ATPase subunit
MDDEIVPAIEPAPEGTAFLEMRGVEKSFGDNMVLKGINLTVSEHELVSLIGASGCGKSTLLRCINALEPIQGGTISIQGKVVSGKGVDVDAEARLAPHPPTAATSASCSRASTCSPT